VTEILQANSGRHPGQGVGRGCKEVTMVTRERTRTRRGLLILAALVILATGLIFSRPPVPQPASYHDFADQRTFFGVPNFMDVASNLPLLIVGVWGLLVVFGRGSSRAFLTRAERWPYAVFFRGVALTCFGSSDYHLHPTNPRLVWDRLPMTLGFMGIVTAVAAERISARAGVLSLGAAGHRRRVERGVLALDGSSRARRPATVFSGAVWFAAGGSGDAAIVSPAVYAYLVRRCGARLVRRREAAGEP
jgi:hypothetical protein